MLFVFALDHIGNVLLYFDLYGHGKLDPKFVQARCELKTGIFAPRAMVVQARDGLCYQKKFNILVYLT